MWSNQYKCIQQISKFCYEQHSENFKNKTLERFRATIESPTIHKIQCHAKNSQRTRNKTYRIPNQKNTNVVHKISQIQKISVIPGEKINFFLIHMDCKFAMVRLNLKLHLFTEKLRWGSWNFVHKMKENGDVVSNNIKNKVTWSSD